jgi:hypothetical protein
MTIRKNLTRSLLAGLTVATALSVAAPAALAQPQAQPDKHKTCIKLLGIKVCVGGLAL